MVTSTYGRATSALASTGSNLIQTPALFACLECWTSQTYGHPAGDSSKVLPTWVTSPCVSKRISWDTIRLANSGRPTDHPANHYQLNKPLRLAIINNNPRDIHDNVESHYCTAINKLPTNWGKNVFLADFLRKHHQLHHFTSIWTKNSPVLPVIHQQP